MPRTLPRTKKLDTKPLLYSHKQIFLNCALLIEENIWIIQIGSFKKHFRSQIICSNLENQNRQRNTDFQFIIHVILLVSNLILFLKIITHPKNVFYLSVIR